MSFQIAYVFCFFVVLIRAMWVLRGCIERNLDQFGWVAAHQFLVCLGYWWVCTFIWNLYLFCGGHGGAVYVGGHAGFR